jgi:predicted O-methyltransferase YrrM
VLRRIQESRRRVSGAARRRAGDLLKGARVRALEAELAEYRRGWPPGHFYSPIPALDEVKRREQELFGPSPAQLPGIDLGVDAQLELLAAVGELTAGQPWSDEPSAGVRYHFDNPNFRHGEALALLGLLRRSRPARILEVGSGYSSAAILDVADRFLQGPACTFVEPYPELLRSLLRPEDDVEVLARPVEAVPLERFERLADGDVLFIDSTHVAKTGSDVNHLVHEVLPRLAPGVVVHFHDIHHPFEYPREWVLEGRAWNEAYVVRAFLEFNAAFEVLLFPSYLAQHHPRELRAAMPLTARGPGSSLWLRRRAGAHVPGR